MSSDSFDKKDLRPTLAIFDFDGTLIRRDSFLLFLKYGLGIFGTLRHLPYFCLCFLRFKQGVLSAKQAKELMLRPIIKGKRAEELNLLCEQFVIEQLHRIERKEAILALCRHQELGHRICIVSASPIDWIIPWAKTKGIDLVIGAKLEQAGQIVTGRLNGPNCNKKEKIRYLQHYIPNFETRYRCYAYGDSNGDQDLLNIVDIPQYRKFDINLIS